MTTTNNTKATKAGSQARGGNKGRFVWPLAGAIAVIGMGGIAVAWLGNQGEATFNGPTAMVERGDLTISVTESGSLRSRDQETVINQVEGSSTIIWIIEEGEEVEEGDLLVELDASSWEERLVDHEIAVENAEANYVQAEQQLKLTKSQTESDIAEARLAKRFAELDLEQYIGEEGEYALELDEHESEIDLAEEEMTRARQEFEDSQELAEQGFITPLELEGDRLAYERAKVDLRMAQGRLNLLREYTHDRELQQRQSDLEQAEESLARTEMRAESDLVQARAENRARRLELEQNKRILNHVKEQIKNSKIYAPADGMVVYETSVNQGRRGNREPLEEGQDVRERQELIYLPASEGMIADVTVHESQLDLIAPDMPARVSVEVGAGRTFDGTVRRIAPMPDRQSIWLNPDLTVYSTEIAIDAEGLRTGMSCQVEILVDELEDVLYVPLQAVVGYRGNQYAYVLTPQGPQPRLVETGLDDNRVVHIREGLEAGEVVLLNPPLADDVEEEEEEIGPEPADDEGFAAEANPQS